MTRRFALSALPLIGVLLLLAPCAAAADNILQLVPDSAWGFVSVTSLADADAKSQALGDEMQLPIPKLLAGFKQVTGIQAGLDEKSPAALVFLPPPANAEIPARVLLLPVADYDSFRDGLNPKSKTGEVTEVTFAGKSAFVRHLGAYAALTDSENAKCLESLQLAGEVPASLKRWSDWISKHDAVGVLLQPGIKSLSAKGQYLLNIMKMKLGQAGDQGKQIAAAFTMYEKLLQTAEKEISAYGVGLQLDKQNTLRASDRAELIPDGNWAKFIAQLPSAKENLLAGLPGEPYVAAGGAALSGAMIDSMMQLSFNLMKNMPQLYGLSEEQIEKMSKEAKPQFKGLHSMSMVLGVGKSDEPLYANMLGLMRVDNAQEFMDGYEKYFQKYNELIKDSKSPLLKKMDVEKCEFAGAHGLKVTMEIPKPQTGPMPPQYDKVMEAMFGPGGKMVFWIAPADEHTVVTGYVSKEPMEKLIADLKQKKPGLVENAELAKTAALLPPDAPFVAYLSPQGTIDLVKRMLADYLPPGMQDRLSIPDFPQTPPLGFAITSAPNELQATLVVPAEVLKAVGKYIQHIRGMSREDVTMNR